MKSKKFSLKTISACFFKLILKFIIHMYGLRFFKQPMTAKTVVLGTTTLTLTNGSELKFTFYKQSYNDVVYKRGYVSRQTYVGYIIGCDFDDNFPEHLAKYNNLKFTLHRSIFHSWLFDYIDEEAIAHLLMDFYVRFIENEMNNNNENATVF